MTAKDWQTLTPATTLAEWAAVFTDVDVWAPAVRMICHRSGLLASTIEAGYPGSNAVFIVDRRYVVKIYAPLWSEDYALECALYPLLARYPELLTPQLVAHGVLEAATTWPYLVMTFLPGEPIREARAQMSRDEGIAVARDLGRRVRILHGIPIERQTVLDTSREGWNSYVARALVHTTGVLSQSGLLAPELVDAIPPFVEGVLARQGTPQLVLVSGDLTDDHVLLTQGPSGWTITGMIDFADSLVAPPAYEWIALWFSTLGRDPEGLAAFAEGYGPALVLDTTFYDSAMATTFLHEYGGEMIKETLQPLISTPIRSMAALRDHLWHR